MSESTESLIQVTQIFVFQVNGTQISPSDPIVTTPWLTPQAAYDAACTYADQLNAWWRKKWPRHPEDYMSYSDIYWDTVHLNDAFLSDPTFQGTIRFGIVPDPNDSPPLPANLTGYYIGPWTDGLDWNPLPM